MSEELPALRPLAVVFGVSRYRSASWDLYTAASDAGALAALLERDHGYDVWLRLDEEVTRDAMHALLGEPLRAAMAGRRQLLVFFAGHGIADDTVEDIAGSLVLHDGDAGAYPMSELVGQLDALDAHHVLLILDCCFAGAIHWARRREVAVPPRMYRERYELYLASPAWQVLTSAAHDQRALDVYDGRALGQRDGGDAVLRSPFADALLKGLAGAADTFPRHGDGTAGDGVITATELFLHVHEALSFPAAGGMRLDQTPGLWRMRARDRGEYLFHHPAKPVTLDDAPALTRETCPYRGVESFEERHAATFFGRTAIRDALIAHVGGRAVTIVIGASGTGKSSLVCAGLLPALRAADPALAVVGPFRPGRDPLAALDAALSAAGAGHRCVVIDQLEEILTQREAGPQPTIPVHARFLARLAELARAGATVVATLRSDFEPALWSGPLHASWDEARFAITDMTQDELREAIERPAEARVLQFDPPALVDRLVNAVVGMPGALPLLSFTLAQLYGELVRRATGDRLLRGSDYDGVAAPGGIPGALQRRADAIRALLDDDGRRMLHAVALRMVTIASGVPTRRRVPLDELEFDRGTDNAQRAAVLEALGAALDTRLVVSGADGEVSYVEPAHDAVVHAWSDVQATLRDEIAVDTLIFHRRCTAASAEWLRAARDARLLWSEPRLGRALAELDRGPFLLNRAERAFVDDSRRAEHARQEAAEGDRRRRRRRAITIAAVVGVALVAAALFSLNRARVAEQQAGVAEARRRDLARQLGETYLELGREDLVENEQPRVALSHLTAAREAGLERTPLAMLFRQATRDLPLATLRHDDAVTIAVFSPDGTHVATASRDGTARLWDATTGRALGPPLRHAAEVKSLVFSRDGTLVATASLDDTARVWDAVTGVPKTEPMRHAEGVTSAVFSDDGARLVTVTLADTVTVWDARAGGVLWRSPRDAPDLDTMDYTLYRWVSPDGTHAISASRRAAEIWDLTSQDLRRTPLDESGSSRSVVLVAFTPDGRRAGIIDQNGVIQIWDLAAGHAAGAYRAPAQVRQAVFSTDGTHLVCVIDGGAVEVWDIGRGAVQAVPSVHDAWRVAISPDGERVAIASTNHIVRLHDLSSDDALAYTGASLGLELRHDDIVRTIAFSPDGARVVTASDDGTAVVWRVTSSQTMPPLLHERVVSARFSADGRRLVTAGRGGIVQIWDATSGRALGPPLVHDERVDIATFSPDGAAVLTASGATAYLWDASTSTVRYTFHHDDDVYAAVFSPDGERIATGSREGTARVWDVRSGRALSSPLRQATSVIAAAFSPDGDRLVTGSTGGVVLIWDATTAKVLAGPFQHTSGVGSVAFSPDGARVVTAGRDGVRIWDSRRGDIGIPTIDQVGAAAASFDPTGTRVLVGGRNMARIWDAAKGVAITPAFHTQPFVPGNVMETDVQAAWSADGTRVVTAGTDGVARIWDAGTGRPLLPAFEHHDLASAGFSPDDARIVTAGGDIARVWDVAADKRPLASWRALADALGGWTPERSPVRQPFDAPPEARATDELESVADRRSRASNLVASAYAQLPDRPALARAFATEAARADEANATTCLAIIAIVELQ